MGRGNSENGLRIKRKLSPRLSVSRIPVVTALEPEDCCDVIFVAVRYTQMETILDALIGQIFASTKYKVTYEPNMGTIFCATRPLCSPRPSPATKRTAT